MCRAKVQSRNVHSIVIPLEQGLRLKMKRRKDYCVRKFYCHSIRTRIKTVQGESYTITQVNSIVIPLEQGLRQ